MAHNRYACLYDLNDYFKKKDLLGGLTEIEQQQLRKNIGIIDYTGEGGQTKPLELAYSTLVNYISRKALVTGARYIITDFQTIYSSCKSPSYSSFRTLAFERHRFFFRGGQACGKNRCFPQAEANP